MPRITKSTRKSIVNGKQVIITSETKVTTIKEFINFDPKAAADKILNDIIVAANKNPFVKKALGFFYAAVLVANTAYSTYKKVLQTIQTIKIIYENIMLFIGAWTNPGTIPVALNNIIVMVSGFVQSQVTGLILYTVNVVLELPLFIETTDVGIKEIPTKVSNDANKILVRQKQAVEQKFASVFLNEDGFIGIFDIESNGEENFTGWVIIEEVDGILRPLADREASLFTYGKGGTLGDGTLLDTEVHRGVSPRFDSSFIGIKETKDSLIDFVSPAKGSIAFVLTEKRYYKYYENESVFNIPDGIEDKLFSKVAEIVGNDVITNGEKLNLQNYLAGIETIDDALFSAIKNFVNSNSELIDNQVRDRVLEILNGILTKKEILDLYTKEAKAFERDYNNNNNLKGLFLSRFTASLSDLLRKKYGNWIEITPDYLLEATRILGVVMNDFLNSINDSLREINIDVASITKQEIDLLDFSTFDSSHVIYISSLSNEVDNISFTDIMNKDLTILDIKEYFDFRMKTEISLLEKLSSTLYFDDTFLDNLYNKTLFYSNRLKKDIYVKAMNVIQNTDVDISTQYDNTVYEKVKMEFAFSTVFSPLKVELATFLKKILDENVFQISIASNSRLYYTYIYYLNYCISKKLKDDYALFVSSLDNIYVNDEVALVSALKSFILTNFTIPNFYGLTDFMKATLNNAAVNVLNKLIEKFNIR